MRKALGRFVQLFAVRKLRSGQIYVNFAGFLADSEAGMHQRLTRLMLAGRDIKLPAVPRACDDAAGQLSLAQRSALMRANAIERMPLARHIEQRHDPALNDALQSLPR